MVIGRRPFSLWIPLFLLTSVWMSSSAPPPATGALGRGVRFFAFLLTAFFIDGGTCLAASSTSVLVKQGEALYLRVEVHSNSPVIIGKFRDQEEIGRASCRER